MGKKEERQDVRGSGKEQLKGKEKEVRKKRGRGGRKEEKRKVSRLWGVAKAVVGVRNDRTGWPAWLINRDGD